MAHGRYEAAVPIYEALAKGEDAEALCDLAFLHDTGRGIPRNHVRACELYERALVCGHPRAYMTVYYSSRRAKERLSVMLQPRLEQIWQQAEQGSAPAQFLAGMCCRNGLGRPKIYEEAYEMFRLSAEQGYAKALVFLGLCLNFGAGCARNDAEAYRCYQQAFRQEDRDALELLAGCYLFGCGTEPEPARAYELLRTGVELHLPNACYTLACHIARLNPDAPPSAAAGLMLAAAKYGHEIALRQHLSPITANEKEYHLH